MGVLPGRLWSGGGRGRGLVLGLQSLQPLAGGVLQHAVALGGRVGQSIGQGSGPARQGIGYGLYLGGAGLIPAVGPEHVQQVHAGGLNDSPHVGPR